MEANTINASTLAKMFLAGAKNLESKKEWINELNVFPVPDGDTGTNMTMTIMSAAKEVSALEQVDMKTLAKAISSGSLRGARGNSGVILSQLLRGFTKAIKEVDQVDVDVLCEALQRAVETAYKAVMKPKEGTILTVAKGAADKALELVDTTDDIVYFIDEVIKEADYVLGKTPDMLPVLKQAGVVDSGGQGLVVVMQGAYDCLLGKEVDYTIETESGSGNVAKTAPEAEAEIKYGYCTEFIIVLDKPLTEAQEQEYKGYLESIGDSIVVVADDELDHVVVALVVLREVRVHVIESCSSGPLAVQVDLIAGGIVGIEVDKLGLAGGSQDSIGILNAVLGTGNCLSVGLVALEHDVRDLAVAVEIQLVIVGNQVVADHLALHVAGHLIVGADEGALVIAGDNGLAAVLSGGNGTVKEHNGDVLVLGHVDDVVGGILGAGVNQVDDQHGSTLGDCGLNGLSLGGLVAVAVIVGVLDTSAVQLSVQSGTNAGNVGIGEGIVEYGNLAVSGSSSGIAGVCGCGGSLGSGRRAVVGSCACCGGGAGAAAGSHGQHHAP